MLRDCLRNLTAQLLRNKVNRSIYKGEFHDEHIFQHFKKEGNVKINFPKSKFRDLSNQISKANISIHLDVSNEHSTAKTGKFSRALVAMVRGYGYENVEVKPNAWCASKLADKHTKRIPSWLR